MLLASRWDPSFDLPTTDPSLRCGLRGEFSTFHLSGPPFWIGSHEYSHFTIDFEVECRSKFTCEIRVTDRKLWQSGSSGAATQKVQLLVEYYLHLYPKPFIKSKRKVCKNNSVLCRGFVLEFTRTFQHETFIPPRCSVTIFNTNQFSFSFMHK